MLLSNVTCPRCHATFVAADAHVRVPHLGRGGAASERSEYRCPKCEAYCVMRLHPLAILAACAAVAGAFGAHALGWLDRRIALAVGGTCVILLLRFGLRARPHRPARDRRHQPPSADGRGAA